MSGIRQILLGLQTSLQSALSILLLLADGLKAVISVLAVVLDNLPEATKTGGSVKGEERSVP